MCGDQPPVEHSQRIEILHGRRAVTLADHAHLVERLGDVRRHRDAVTTAGLHPAPQILRRTGVGGMRRQSRTDARRSLAFLDERGQVAFEGFEPRIEVARTEQRPHPRAIDRIENLRLRPVHVDERRHAAQQHLDHAERHAQRHIVGRLTRLEGPDIVVEPLHQGDVVGKAALQGHGRMAVGVHQPRHHEFAPAVELPKPGVRRAELRGGRFRLRDQRDSVAVDAHPARKGAGGVPDGRHRQHRRV